MSLARGKSYANSGHVKSWTLSPDGKLLTATVRGSSTYRQSIELVWSDSKRLVNLAGMCTCPVGFNCKHVAAALVVAEAAGALSGTPGSVSPATQSNQRPYRTKTGTVPPVPHARTARSGLDSVNASKTQMLATEIHSWLRQFERQCSNNAQDSQSATDPNQYPASVKDRIRHVVHQSRDRITILPMKVSVRKDGSLGNARPSHYEIRNISYDNPPKFILPADLRIFRLMSLYGRDWTAKATQISDDEEGQTLLKLALESGRAYWSAVDGLLLRPGAPRHGTDQDRFAASANHYAAMDQKHQASSSPDTRRRPGQTARVRFSQSLFAPVSAQ